MPRLRLVKLRFTASQRLRVDERGITRSGEAAITRDARFTRGISVMLRGAACVGSARLHDLERLRLNGVTRLLPIRDLRTGISGTYSQRSTSRHARSGV